MISTDINIKITIDDNVDLEHPKNTDKIQIDIAHDNCGNEKLDNFADNLARMFNYIIDTYQTIMKEEIAKPQQETSPTIETQIKE